MLHAVIRLVNAFIFCSLNQQLKDDTKTRLKHQQLRNLIEDISGVPIIQDDKLKGLFLNKEKIRKINSYSNIQIPKNEN